MTIRTYGVTRRIRAHRVEGIALMPVNRPHRPAPVIGRTGSIGSLFAAVALALATVVVPPGGAVPARALDDGLARTPPMGFNDWNAFGCDVTEQLIKDTADLFVSTGLKDAGYEYVNIDDCWMTHERDPETGRLVPDPVKFPSGIDGTADYVHAKGLKLGIYEDAGTETCAGYPGSLGHEEIDAQTFADWGVDYLKYDNCNNAGSSTQEEYIERYTAMRDALKATGRDIVYSICEWGTSRPWEWADKVGHLWRTTGDISDNWSSMLSLFKQNAPLAQYAKPGAWNDPDMLEVGNGGMTDTEYRSHFSLWAIMAAPLLIGTDLREATPETMEIYLNKDVIAVDQDPLGKQGVEIVNSGGRHVLAKPLANGDVAVALFNETSSPTTITTTAAAAGARKAPAYVLQDLWSKKKTETAGTITANVPAHGTVMYRVSQPRDWDQNAPSTSLSVDKAAAYDGGPVVVHPGRDEQVGTTLTNSGRAPVSDAAVTLTAPDGWAVRATSPRTRKEIPTDKALSTQWSVAVPADAEPGSYTLSATAAYSWKKPSKPPKPGAPGISETVHGALQVLVPEAPPSGSPWLSDLTWTSVSNGWGPAELDTSNGEQPAGDGNPITIGGVTYEKGLGVHAASEVVYYLGGNCSSFTSDVGLDDEKDSNRAGLVSFQVYADGDLVADSGEMTWEDAAKTLTASTLGADFLRLVVDTEGSTNSDHADWAGAKLACDV